MRVMSQSTGERERERKGERKGSEEAKSRCFKRNKTGIQTLKEKYKTRHVKKIRK